MQTEQHLILLREGASWLCYRHPRRVHVARTPGEVPQMLRAASTAQEEGLHAVGFISYEAAPAFDPAFRAHPAGPLPAAWFGIYDPPERIPAAQVPAAEGGSPPAWHADLPRAAYDAAIAAIKGHIAAGNTYQVNFTMRMHSGERVDPWTFFLAHVVPSDAPHAAWLDLGDFAIASASPELFFAQEGDHVTCRPMKGTSARGRTPGEDEARRRALQGSVKDRAENVMIVDMIRNDLGRVAYPGQVQVSSLFDVETYYTAHQMTSTVTARTGHDPVRVLAALFPCASITGAPKVRTMALIRDLESSPRGIYTGAIGCFAPGRRARFSVAIRTLITDRATGLSEYGTGGGIVWDSAAAQEWEECRVKTGILQVPPPRFRLLETLLYLPGEGFWLSRRHLDRLRASAAYFGFHLDEKRIEEAVQAFGADGPARVRLLVAADGSLEWQAQPLDGDPRDQPRRRTVRLDDRPVDAGDRFLYHKTTNRARYDDALARHPECDDVLLWNERGECTESCRANLVWEQAGRRWTPDQACGLLAGTLRRELLERGELREARLPVAALSRVDRLWLINAVRGWMPIRVVFGVGQEPQTP